MNETLHAILLDYFRCLNEHNGVGIQQYWHPKGLLFINGEERLLAFLENMPAFVGFEIEKVERANISGTAASAVVRWVMKMPGSHGYHVSHFTLVNGGEGWRIASQVDNGIEE